VQYVDISASQGIFDLIEGREGNVADICSAGACLSNSRQNCPQFPFMI
jgi:hypothetical protein